MSILEPTGIIAIALLIGLATITLAMLHGWHCWLALKQHEINQMRGEIGPIGRPFGHRLERPMGRNPERPIGRNPERLIGPLERSLNYGSQASAARIEIADMKERIRKLEAIANGVDL